MKALSISEIKTLPHTPYGAIRPQLRTGDLMFAAGTYPLSKAIQKASKSPWSHVGIVVVQHEIDRVLLLEAEYGAGVRLIPLSKYLLDYDNTGQAYEGPLVLTRIDDLTPEIAKKALTFGVDELGRPFDTQELAMIAVRLVLGEQKLEHDRSYLCSELVYECFAHAGRIFDGGKDHFVAPNDIWNDPQLSLLGRIQ